MIKIEGPLGFVIIPALITDVNKYIIACTEGTSIKLKIEGVGNKVVKESTRNLIFSLGNSYPVSFRVPSTVKIDVINSTGTLIEVKGILKEEVTKVVAELKRLKRISPYQLKGIYPLIDQSSVDKIKLKVKRKK
jgi:ribosomal protein L6P/L9E